MPSPFQSLGKLLFAGVARSYQRTAIELARIQVAIAYVRGIQIARLSALSRCRPRPSGSQADQRAV